MIVLSRGAEVSQNARAVEQIIIRAWILPHNGEIPLQSLVLRKALGDAVPRGHLLATPTLAVDRLGWDDSVERLS